MRREFSSRPYFIPGLLSAVLLLIAIGHWPYNYYTVLRLVVCISGIYIAYTAHQRSLTWIVWCFSFIALLFNPLIPVHLSRAAWQPIDIAAAIAFVYISISTRDKIPR